MEAGDCGEAAAASPPALSEEWLACEASRSVPRRNIDARGHFRVASLQFDGLYTQALALPVIWLIVMPACAMVQEDRMVSYQDIVCLHASISMRTSVAARLLPTTDVT